MANTLVDLVKIRAASIGTGTVVLGEAVPGFRGKEALASGQQYGYSIRQDAQYEVGVGTFIVAGSLLVRAVKFSSNGGGPIEISADTEIAFVALAVDLLQTPGPPGPQGLPGAGGNVAVGRAQLKAVAASTGDVWTLSEGRRSGDFELLPNVMSVPSDPTEAVFISNNAGRVFRRIGYEQGINIGWAGAICNAVESGNTATGTNDRAAVQAAIDLARALRITDVIIPGPTLVGSGFDVRNGVYSQLFTPYSGDIADQATTVLKGTSAPPVSGGVTGLPSLISTDTAGAGSGVICSVVGCQAPVGSDRSWSTLYVEDLIIRTPQNTPSTGINAEWMHQYGLRGSARIDVFGGFGGSGVTLQQNHYSQSYGVIGGRNNLPINNTIDNALIYGYGTGLRVGELTQIDTLVVSGCTTAAEFPECQHPTRISTLIVLSCVTTLKVTGAHEVQIANLDMEHTPLPSGWDARGYDLDSDSAYLRGNLNWHVHEGPYRFEVKPGSDLNVGLYQRPPFQQSGTAFSNLFNGFSDLVSVSGMNRLTELRTGRSPWEVIGASKTGATDLIGAKSWCNFDTDKSDYRIAQHIVLTNGNSNSGQQIWATAKNGTLTNHIGLDSNGWFYFFTHPPIYADETAAKAAGIPQGVICEKPDGSLFRQRIA